MYNKLKIFMASTLIVTTTFTCAACTKVFKNPLDDFKNKTEKVETTTEEWYSKITLPEDYSVIRIPDLNDSTTQTSANRVTYDGIKQELLSSGFIEVNSKEVYGEYIQLKERVEINVYKNNNSSEIITLAKFDNTRDAMELYNEFKPLMKTLVTADSQVVDTIEPNYAYKIINENNKANLIVNERISSVIITNAGGQQQIRHADRIVNDWLSIR